MVVYLLMFACAAAMLTRIYRYDLYDKEPAHMVALALALGFGTMALAGIVERWLFDVFGLGPADISGRIVIVALVEDSFKLICVLLIARLAMRHFNDPLDGVIYGTLVGLGAGVEESLIYIAQSPGTLLTAGTEVIRLFAHAMMGGLVGLGVGLGARPGRAPRHHVSVITVCLLITGIIHFAWDWFAYQPALAQSHRPVFVLLMAVLMSLWGAAVRYAARKSGKVFNPMAHSPRLAGGSYE